MRDALADLVRSDPALDLVAVAADAVEAIKMADFTRPDVAILDVRMPSGGGIAAAVGIARGSPATRVIALSSVDDQPIVLEMLRAGAVRFVVKGESPKDFLETIRQSAAGDRHSS